MNQHQTTWTKEDILGLSLVPRMKATALIRLVPQFGSLEKCFQTIPAALQELGISENSLFDVAGISSIRERASKQLEICGDTGVKIITFWDDEYPQLLREIDYPPAILYVRGELQAADAIAVSIVGTRRCTVEGKLITEQFAQNFARNNVVIVSGLANGIDTTAHKATLKAGGITYAVIASGCDKISPYLSEQTAQEIVASGGAIVSEYPCGTKALPAYFPNRNRIISGISKATVVIESGEKGGSLITARFAVDQNRELFAVPGKITSPESRGTNLLIKRNMAGLVLSPDDVLESLGLLSKSIFKKNILIQSQNLPELEQRIFDLLRHEPLHIDSLAEMSGMLPHELLPGLLDLEFKNLVRQLTGKYFVKIGI